MIKQGPPEIGRPKPLAARKRKDRHAQLLDSPDELLSWRIDWREYFLRFVEAHGGNPMEIGGRLVFEDGWSHSATDYRGPEWPPPDKPLELRALLLAYWTARRDEVGQQLRKLRQVKRNLDELITLRSMPLTRKVKTGRDENGVTQWDRQVIDGEELSARMRWLRADLVNSAEQIEELSNGKKADSGPSAGAQDGVHGGSGPPEDRGAGRSGSRPGLEQPNAHRQHRQGGAGQATQQRS